MSGARWIHPDGREVRWDGSCTCCRVSRSRIDLAWSIDHDLVSISTPEGTDMFWVKWCEPATDQLWDSRVGEVVTQPFVIVLGDGSRILSAGVEGEAGALVGAGGPATQ